MVLYLSTLAMEKAANNMLKNMAETPAYWKQQKVLFIHTGGLLGLHDKTEQMASMMVKCQRWKSMKLSHERMELLKMF